MRAIGVVRITPDDVGHRVTVRRRVTDGGAPTTSDVVGTLLAHDGERLVVRRRDGGRVRMAVATLVAGRTIPPRPAAAVALDPSPRDPSPAAARWGASLQLCANGARARGEHPALPLDPAALTADARAAAAVGVRLFHVHARDATGAESLAPTAVEATVRAVRAGAPGCEVSVSTGAWIEGDAAGRAALVERWEELPDVASVNPVEDGAVELAGLLGRLGVGLEAGIASATDLQLLVASGLDRRCQRILIEPPPDAVEAAITLAADLHARAPVDVTHLVHGEEATAWPLLRWAAAHDVLTRIGLEDVLVGPHGEPTAGNAALVASATEVLAADTRGSG